MKNPKRILDTCNYCLRKVPNTEYFTKNGCIWCDYKYYQEKLL